VTESVLPEVDDDSVRIMTIHASKGLEFPIVVMTGRNTAADGRGGRRVLWGDGVPEVAVSKTLRSAGYEARSGREEEMEEHERLRLLYVAATRARDHLVVSLHHKAGTACAAARLEAAAAADPTTWRRPGPPTPVAARPGARSRPPRPDPDDTPVARVRWAADREVRLAAAERPRTLAATAVARLLNEPSAEPAEDPGGVAPDGEGGAGTARPGVVAGPGPRWARAVHATLQLADLGGDPGLTALAEVQAVAEGVPARAGEIERLARAALESPTVRRAVARRALLAGALRRGCRWATGCSRASSTSWSTRATGWPWSTTRRTSCPATRTGPGPWPATAPRGGLRGGGRGGGRPPGAPLHLPLPGAGGRGGPRRPRPGPGQGRGPIAPVGRLISASGPSRIPHTSAGCSPAPFR